MLRQLNILLFVILLPSFGSAQEVVSVYFKTGSHKVSAYSAKVIEEKLNSLNYEGVTYIGCIGYSDSSGNVQSNQRLSERRAKAVAKECTPFLKDDVPVEVSFRGETQQKVDSLSRRVDIVIFYISNHEAPDTIPLTANNERCFGTDESIYGFIHAKTSSGKQKASVFIELIDYSITQRKHYYIKNPGTPNATAQRVNWKKQKTGKLWWREIRYTATIPKESFDKYGLVLFAENPCSGCPESLFKQDTNLVTGTTFTENYFLESITQLKTKRLRPNQVEMRIPREYIDTNLTYHILLLTLSNERQGFSVDWKTGKKKKNKDYYFYDFNKKNYDYFSIQSEKPQWTCPEPVHFSYDTTRYRRLGCGCHWTSDYLYIRTTLSAFYHNDTLTSYAALRFGYQGRRSQLQAEIGINHRLGFYGSLAYRFNYLNIGLMKNGGSNHWQEFRNVEFSTIFNPYFGVEMRTSYNGKYKSFNELNLHTGFSVNYSNRFGYSVHGGLARDYSNTINTRFYPFIQAGITYTFTFRLN